MGRVHSSAPIPVEQAQLIDPIAFRFDTSQAKALGDIGKVLMELGVRKKDMQDRIAVSNMNAAMEQAQLDYQRDIIGKPIEERDAIMFRHIQKAKSISGQQKMSSEARSLAQNKVEIWGQTFSQTAQIQNIKDLEKDALIGVTDDYVKALAEGTPQDIAEAEIPFKEQVNSSFNPEEAERYIEEQEALAVKQMEDNAVSEQKNLSAINPVGRMDAIQAELDSRKAGNEPSVGWKNIDDSTLREIEKYTQTLIGKQKTQSEIKMQESLNNAYSAVRDGATDIDAIIDVNNADPTQTTEEKLDFAEKLPTYFNKINSTKIPSQTNENVYDVLTKASEAVERGAMTPTAFEELFADSVTSLTPEDRRSIRSRDVVATQTMQNRAFTDAVMEAKSILVQATEDQVTAMNTARQVAELEGDIKSINMFNAALTKHSAQVWQQSRLRKELRSMIAQNEQWSQKEIFSAGEVLTNQLDIPDAELIRLYDAGNPKLDVLGKSPVPALDDIWKSLDRDTQSLILNLKIQGAPDSDIVQELESEQP
jgi:hypothetical protein